MNGSCGRVWLPLKPLLLVVWLLLSRIYLPVEHLMNSWRKHDSLLDRTGQARAHSIHFCYNTCHRGFISASCFGSLPQETFCFMLSFLLTISKCQPDACAASPNTRFPVVPFQIVYGCIIKLPFSSMDRLAARECRRVNLLSVLEISLLSLCSKGSFWHSLNSSMADPLWEWGKGWQGGRSLLLIRLKGHMKAESPLWEWRLLFPDCGD